MLAIGLAAAPGASAGQTLAVCLQGECATQEFYGEAASNLTRVARGVCATALGEGAGTNGTVVCVPTERNGVTIAGLPFAAVTSEDYLGDATVGLNVFVLP